MTSNRRVAYVSITLALAFAVSGILAVHGEEAEPPAPAADAASIADMDWLAGEWSGNMWGGEFRAYYSTPEGGKIISHSRLIQKDQEMFYEFEVFQALEDSVRLQPYPSGKRAKGLTLASYDSSARKAVFENPDKDYPTRITYQRVADDNLVITLSDPHGGSDKVETFDLER